MIRSTPGLLSMSGKVTPIDDDQTFFVGRAIAIDITIHSTIARATKGQVNQSVPCSCSFLFLLK